jgi:hypothetical protein
VKVSLCSAYLTQAKIINGEYITFWIPVFTPRGAVGAGNDSNNTFYYLDEILGFIQ